MRPRKTLEQMAREAAQDGGEPGYACPRCGCKDWRGEKNSGVEFTRHPEATNSTVRKRICRHCGQVGFKTEEVVVPEGHKLKVVPEDEEEEVAA